MRCRSLPLCLLLLLFGLCSVASIGQELPVRIDSPRNAAVWIKTVDVDVDFRKVSDSTPTVVDVKPGERIDVKVRSRQGFFTIWEGERQSVAGPANITMRLEKKIAWERVVLVSAVGISLLVGFLLMLRKRALRAARAAETQIFELEERVAKAETVGSLARTLGDYKVLDKLGAGAMGVVYKVENSAGDIFAAKVPNEMDERVLREAEVSASLKSPHIVECYGLVKGQTEFLLLEFLDGQTVHEWMANHARLPLETIDDLVRQLLDAVEVAHSQGIYHRDIKPENLFLVQTGSKPTLKVMDFGLASSVNAARLTRTGQAMGTPIYASPEQLSGNKVDATTDLYSVGVFIFELATGTLPWKKTDPVALTLEKYKPLPKEPIALRPDLPMAWNQLVVDLLDGDSCRRPKDVAEVKRRWNDGKLSFSKGWTP